MRWRWDQGRLEYFRFDNVVRIAETLTKLDGAPLNVGEDPLRGPLVEHTGLEFKPGHYRVWRNYARVFRCALLATVVDHRLAVTSLCRKLADPSSGVTPGPIARQFTQVGNAVPPVLAYVMAKAIYESISAPLCRPDVPCVNIRRIGDVAAGLPCRIEEDTRQLLMAMENGQNYDSACPPSRQREKRGAAL